MAKEHQHMIQIVQAKAVASVFGKHGGNYYRSGQTASNQPSYVKTAQWHQLPSITSNSTRKHACEPLQYTNGHLASIFHCGGVMISARLLTQKSKVRSKLQPSYLYLGEMLETYVLQNLKAH